MTGINRVWQLQKATERALAPVLQSRFIVGQVPEDVLEAIKLKLSIAFGCELKSKLLTELFFLVRSASEFYSA